MATVPTGITQGVTDWISATGQANRPVTTDYAVAITDDAERFDAELDLNSLGSRRYAQEVADVETAKAVKADLVAGGLRADEDRFFGATSAPKKVLVVAWLRVGKAAEERPSTRP